MGNDTSRTMTNNKTKPRMKPVMKNQPIYPNYVPNTSAQLDTYKFEYATNNFMQSDIGSPPKKNNSLEKIYVIRKCS